MIKYLLLIVFLLPVYTFAANHQSSDYIIDTDIGGDIDDVFALLGAMQSVTKPLAVTTSHIEPEEKARIAKFIMTLQGYSDIPVYAGIGVKRNDDSQIFKTQNPLWPPMYGYPHPINHEKEWHKLQAIAYKENNEKLFSDMQVETESAPEFIVRLAKHYSPENKLVIVALAPMHNIAAALVLDPSISKNIIIYSMGGLYPKGYNWLISPQITQRVLLDTEIICITSELIEIEQLYFSVEDFNFIEKNVRSDLGKMILTDWQNWHHIDQVNKRKTQLGDYVTLYLALHPEEITHLAPQNIYFPCLDQNGNLKPEFIGHWYSEPGFENKIVVKKYNQQSHIYFVTSIDSAKKIKNILFEILKKL